MRLLIDEALSWRVAEGLRQAGHDAIHVRDLGLASAPDVVILQRALAEARTVVSADTDFAKLLAAQSASQPSLILLRPAPDNPAKQTAVLSANLRQLDRAVAEGCVAIIEQSRIRLRRLPIEDTEN